MIRGMGNSMGIAIGTALKIYSEAPVVEKRAIADTEKEIVRLGNAIEAVDATLSALAARARIDIGEEKAEIFEVQSAFLLDPSYVGAIKEAIRTQSVNAEWAIRETTDSLSRDFGETAGTVIKERANDLGDIADKLIRALQGLPEPDALQPGDDTIIVARDLSPTQTLRFDFSKVRGLAIDLGGITSHTSIIAKARGLPAVVGAKGLFESVSSGDDIIVDALSGKVILKPSSRIIEEYRKQIADARKFSVAIAQEPHGAVRTADGRGIAVEANIGKPSDAEEALAQDADGIGLFRSEFLYLERDSLPTEELQFEAYRKVASLFGAKPVVIRTLDIGGDKPLPYLLLPPEKNPFLGLRAIRVSLRNPSLFNTQLRALLRASCFGKLSIMIPMISSVTELVAAREALEAAKRELDAEGVAYDKDVRLGIMVETPAAVMLSDLLADSSSFFSVGTNDLTQYVTAVDRMSNELSDLYSPYHPAVIRSIKRTVEGARRRGISVAVCGEAAGDMALAPLLIGLGVDTLSASPSLIPGLKWLVRRVSFTDCAALAEEALTLATIDQVKSLASEFWEKIRKVGLAS
jgi:phosphoenolpyruvate-protein phosphotransferase (PTS system enzyme I)